MYYDNDNDSSSSNSSNMSNDSKNSSSSSNSSNINNDNRNSSSSNTNYNNDNNSSSSRNINNDNFYIRSTISPDLPPQDPIKRRNALHLAINGSSDHADQALDLEMILLRSDVRGVFARDVRGRTPLHYAFVKMGRHRDASRTDPIEV